MNAFRFGRFELRPAQRTLLRDGVALPLGARAFDLLLALVQHRERVVGAEELFALIWPGLVVEENNLRQQVAALRKLIGTDAVTTVPGRGYRFALPLDGEPTATPLRGPAIAVLPFANLSGDPAQEYFSDAIAQDIITALSKHRWLTVMARNTVFGYRQSSVDARRLGRELGVQYVVEGSVRRAGSRMRVSAELIDAATGVTCWSERYDREVSEVFELQDEITETIVGRLEPEIGWAERRKVERGRRADLPAWDCYHLGVSHFFRFTAADNREALRLLQHSRELDPGFGEAHAWWAYATVLDMVYWSSTPTREALDGALDAVQQALVLDDQNAVFYALKGRVQLARGEYDRARAENEMAILLNPTLAAAHCGLGDTLAYQARYAEALERFRKALALSPRDPQRWAFLTYGALAMIFKEDFRLAAEWTAQAREIPNCQYWATAHQAVAHACLGEQERAAACVEQLLREQPAFSVAFAAEKLFYIRDERQKGLYLAGLARAGVPG